ncbi:MAG: hypothetical protein RR228_03320 [Bacilli bacterium]
MSFFNRNRIKNNEVERIKNVYFNEFVVNCDEEKTKEVNKTQRY